MTMIRGKFHTFYNINLFKQKRNLLFVTSILLYSCELIFFLQNEKKKQIPNYLRCYKYKLSATHLYPSKVLT